MKYEMLKKLMGLFRPFWLLIAGATLLGAATILANVGLLATSAVLISRAALMPPILDLMTLIVGVRFFGISRALFRYSERYVTHDIALRILSRIRIDTYQRLLPLVPAGVKGIGNSQLFSRMTNDIEVLKYFYLKSVAVPLAAIVVLMVCGVIVYAFSPLAAIILIILMIIGGVVVPLAVRGVSKSHVLAYGSLKEQLMVKLADYIKGLADIKLSGADKRYRQQLDHLQVRMVKEQLIIGGIHNLTTNLVTFFSHLALWGSLVATIPLVSSGQLSGVYLAMVILVVWASFEAIIPFPQGVIQLEQSAAAAQNLFCFPKPEASLTNKGMKQVTFKHLDIHFEQVSFAYTAEQSLYQDLTMIIPQGSKIALVGTSGSGKSTLTNLLLKFWQPDHGQITLGGHRLSEIDDCLVRDKIAVVNQEPYLFNATIRENLLLANEDASEETLYWALEQANLLDVVNQLPDGLDSFVGNNGVKLSGGQRQRLAIARMFLQDKPIIILDEATQSLDSLTARTVLERMEKWSQNKTVITITHSLERLDQYDCIYVFDHGKLIESGKEKDLLADQGHYYRLWQIEQHQIA